MSRSTISSTVAVAACLLAVTGIATADDILVIDRVKVRTKKADGKPWDFGGGAPDLYVVVERTSKPKGEKHITAARANAFQAIFNRPALGVNKGDELEVRVMDEDGAADDEVGRTTLKVTPTLLKSKRVELAFDQVTKLVLVIRD